MTQSFQELIHFIKALPVVKQADGLYVRAVRLTAEDAFRLVGIDPPEDWKKVPRPDEGLHNLSNRPYRPSEAKRIAAAILDGEYEFTGEPIIISDRCTILDGQHRLGGLLWATSLWKKAMSDGTIEERYPTWTARPPAIDVVVLCGIRGAGRVANKINTGRSRSISDVVYRDYKFSPHFDKKDRDALSRMLTPAARLVWGRINGRFIRNTPKFDQREAMTFVYQHPGIVAMVEFVYTLDRSEDDQLCVSRIVPPSQIAGLGYLMSVARTPPGQGRNNPEELDYSLMEDAKQFITSLVKGENLSSGNPILLLRNRLMDVKGRSSGARERDERVGAIVLAWNAWIDQRRSGLRMADITPDPEMDPRIGGLDVA